MTFVCYWPNAKLTDNRKAMNDVKVITEGGVQASITLFLVASNTFRAFVKTGDVLNVGIGNIIISSDAFGQHLTTNARNVKMYQDQFDGIGSGKSDVTGSC